MTVSSTSRVAGPFLGTGADATLPFSFQVFTAGDVDLELADGTSVPCTVTINSDQINSPGGNVAVVGAHYTSGTNFYVVSVVAETQSSTLPNQGAWAPKVVETSLDRLTVLVQQVSARVARAFVVAFDEAPPETVADLAGEIVPYLPPDLKGDPGSAGEGYGTRGLLALAGNAATNSDDAYLNEGRRAGKFLFFTAASYNSLTGRTLTADVAADTGQILFVAKQADATGAGGAWVRLDYLQRNEINILWAGAIMDNATNDGAAVAACIALSYALRAIGNTLYPGFGAGAGPGVLVPGFAYMGTTGLTLAHAFRLRGYSNGIPQTWASGLRWDDGVTGITITDFPSIEGLMLLGGFSGTEGEYHAIRCESKFSYRDLCLWNWSGDGMNIGGANCNDIMGSDVFVAHCRYAYYNAAGSNNSACSHKNWNITDCRAFGFYEPTFLGNHHSGHQTASCGITPFNDGVNIPVSVVTYSGNRYFVVVGQESWCSTNAPSGTTADNQGWAYLSAGGAASGLGIYTWFSGILCRGGGGYYGANLNAPTAWINCYNEGGQGLPQLGGQAIGIGGNLSASIWQGTSANPGAPGLRAGGGYLRTGAPVMQTRGYRGGDEIITTTLGENSTANKSLLTIAGSATAPNLWRIFELQSGGDITLASYQNIGSYRSTKIVGPGTSEQGGTGAALAGGAMLFSNFYVGSSFTNARAMTNGTAAPTTGAHGQGEIVWNRSATVGQPKGWMCTVSGTPGTWVSMGSL